MTKELAEPRGGGAWEDQGGVGLQEPPQCSGSWAAAGGVGKGDAGMREGKEAVKTRRLERKTPGECECGIPSIVFP